MNMISIDLKFFDEMASMGPTVDELSTKVKGRVDELEAEVVTTMKKKFDSGDRTLHAYDWKLKECVNELVNEKFQELFTPASPLFKPSSPLELRLQDLLSQINMGKTNTCEVQKVVTTKNSEFEETQKQLKFDVQTHQKQISEVTQ